MEETYLHKVEMHNCCPEIDYIENMLHIWHYAPCYCVAHLLQEQLHHHNLLASGTMLLDNFSSEDKLMGTETSVR